MSGEFQSEEDGGIVKRPEVCAQSESEVLNSFQRLQVTGRRSGWPYSGAVCKMGENMCFVKC